MVDKYVHMQMQMIFLLSLALFREATSSCLMTLFLYCSLVQSYNEWHAQKWPDEQEIVWFHPWEIKLYWMISGINLKRLVIFPLPEKLSFISIHEDTYLYGERSIYESVLTNWDGNGIEVTLLKNSFFLIGN